MRLVQAALLFAVSASPALAQRAPVLVIPGKPGVPVIINGVDVSYAVIEGEFGLSRPIMVNPTVIYRPLAIPSAYGPDVDGPDVDTDNDDRDASTRKHFFPSTGRRPGYGRLEILPPPDRPKPPPAPTFYRSWSSQSGSGPVTDYAPSPPMDIDVSPSFGNRGWRHRNHRKHPTGPGRSHQGP
jgi:hypothetical protein